MASNKPQSAEIFRNMLTESESMVHAVHDRADDRGWFTVSQMSRLLQIYAYALRAKRMLGRTGAQSRKAKRHRLQFFEDVWREAAGKLGATVEVLSKGILEISRGGVKTRVHQNYTPLDGPDTVRISRAKPIVRTMLRSHGLPTPNDAEFSLNELKKAYGFLAQHRLCVVKPACGTGSGVGITTGLETPRQLFKAALRAAGYGPRLLIEEQIEGDTIRLLYLDGQLLDAVKRSPPTVVGDGKSRVSQLVESLNQRRLSAGYKLAQAILKYDMDMERSLARQDLSWRSVPADGQRIVLKGVINDNMADENVSVVDQVCESVIAAGRLAAKLIGARLVGIDIITPDVRQGLEEAGGKILELNTTPGYHYHYFTQNGTCRVAVPILKTCLDHASWHPLA
jgi:D-alanine-D-alanine ligase-like ATP-grasp enzyme